MSAVVLFPDAQRFLTPASVVDLPKRKPRDLATEWAAIRAAATRFGRSAWELTPETAPAIQEARAALDLEASPALGVEAMGVIVRALGNSNDAGLAVRWAASSASAAAAVEALAEANTLDLESIPRVGLRIVRRAPRRPVLGSGIDEIVLRANDEERAAVDAVVARRWPTAAVGERLALVEASPDRPDLANELAEAWTSSRVGERDGWRVLAARVDDLAVVRRLLVLDASASVVDLVRRFGLEAMPLLVEALAKAKETHSHKHLARAVACFDHLDAALALGAAATRVGAVPIVVDYFQRHPTHAEVALRPHASGRSRAAKTVGEILERTTRAGITPGTQAETTTRRSTQKATRSATATASEATAPKASGGTIPAALLGLAAAKRQPVVLDAVPAIAFAPRLLPDPTVDAARVRELARVRADKREADWIESFEREVREGGPSTNVRDWAALPVERAIALYETWPVQRRHILTMAEDAMVWLGLGALNGIVRHAARVLEEDDSFPLWALRVVAPEMAMTLLAAAGSHDQAPLVGDWLALHPEAALAGVLPTAVGPLGPERTLAERGLVELARRHGETFVRETADAVSARAREAVDEILAHRARLTIDRKTKLPSTISVEALPPVRLRGTQTVLPVEAMTELLALLSRSGHALEHPALPSVREACEARDLAELGWFLARSWELGGAKARDTWMIDSLLSLARDDEDVVRRMLPDLKKDRALEVLASIGSDAATVELLGATERGNKRWHAQRGLARIVRRRGLASLADLEETLTPAFVEGNAMRFEHRGQTYEALLDERLELVLRDAGGRVVKRLPPAEDDAGEDARMRARLAELQADVPMLARRRVIALERRMIFARTMSASDFERHHHRHSLWGSIARGLVWSWHLGTDREPSGTFRIAEDGSLADAHDQPITIPAHATIGVPHPLRLDDALRTRWSSVLHDYEIVQPFAQLGRALRLPTEADLRESSASRHGSEPSAEVSGPLDLALAGAGNATYHHRVSLPDERVLVVQAQRVAPFTITLTLNRMTGPSTMERRPLSELGAILVAEYFAALGAI
ncbi:MAG: DUF4132 domain-containing protein [Deltaproteobacteria bacterium]|nr:DUF4132 domain-containing protein [Deltaproteobacteria bacterium]